MRNPTIKEIIEELNQIPEDLKNETIVSIGTLSGITKYRFCIHTEKGNIDLGKTNYDEN